MRSCSPEELSATVCAHGRYRAGPRSCDPPEQPCRTPTWHARRSVARRDRHFHVAETLLNEYRVSAECFRPVVRLDGPHYAALGRIITQPNAGEAEPVERR